VLGNDWTATPTEKRQNGRATGYEGELAAAPRRASLGNSFVRLGHASLRIGKTLGILFVGVFHSQLPQARAFGRCDVRHMHLYLLRAVHVEQHAAGADRNALLAE
jgi:hypothetical protein